MQLRELDLDRRVRAATGGRGERHGEREVTVLITDDGRTNSRLVRPHVHDDADDSRTLEDDYRPGTAWGAHALYVAQTALQLLGALL